MSEMTKNIRNVVIVLAIAALVVLLPGGGRGANTAIQAIWMGFLGAFAWIVYVLYREHKTTLYALGDARRAIVYGAVGVAVLTLTAGSRLLATGSGTIVLIALLGISAYTIFAVVWSARRY
jgi:uncharacterized membrane protein YjjB (DUF3815 family)